MCAWKSRPYLLLLLAFGLGAPLSVFPSPCPPAFSELASPASHPQVPSEVARETADELKGILSNVFNKRPEGPVTGSEFNELFDQLSSLAEKYGIQLTHKTDVIGVFPKGLYELQLSGFGRIEDTNKPVSFAANHELGHLFHTIQCRISLIRSLSPSGAPLSSKDLRAAENYLAKLESGGPNYRQFEKAVGGASSLAHLLRPGARDGGLYHQRLANLIDGVEIGLQKGKIQFPNGKSLEEVYALFLSKAPLVVGKSGGELAVRLPFILFAAMVATNYDMEALGLDPKKWGVKVKPKRGGYTGFRDFLLALIHPQTS